MIKNNGALSSLLYNSCLIEEIETSGGKILSLPRLSGQMASTIMSVGNEQKRSKGKFVLQRKDCCDSPLFICSFSPDLTASDSSQVGCFSFGSQLRASELHWTRSPL